MINKKYITTFFLVMLLNTIALSFWFFLFSTIRNKHALIVEKRVEIEKTESLLESRRFLKKTIAEVSKEKEKLDSIFLSKQEIIKIIKKIESIAVTASVALDIDGVVDSQKEDTMNLVFSLDGDFGKLFHFIVLFENLPYPMDISKLFLVKQKKGPWKVSLEVSLKFLHYENS